MVRVLDARRASIGTQTLRHPAREPAPARARAGRARALRQGLRRRRVRVPVRLVRARGHRQPHRLRSEAARRVQRQGSRATSTRRRASASCRTSSSRRPAPTAPRSRSWSTPTTRTSPRARRAPCCASHPRLAPIKAAVFPLLRKDGQPEKAQRDLRHAARRTSRSHYDQAGSIGRRYRRQDEIGTPFGITVDHQTHAGRHRDAARPRLDAAGPHADRSAGRTSWRSAWLRPWKRSMHTATRRH